MADLVPPTALSAAHGTETVIMKPAPGQPALSAPKGDMITEGCGSIGGTWYLSAGGGWPLIGVVWVCGG